MKEYQVNFTAHHIINVEAETEKEAREEAISLFDGFTDWDVEVEKAD